MRAKKLAILLLSVALAAMLTGCPWDQDEPSGSSSGSSSSSSSSRPDDGGDEDGGSSGSSSSSSSSSQPEAPVVESIQVQARKTVYFYGEAVDPATLTVTAHYNDNTSHEVTNFTISPDTFSAAGTYSVTVTYTENGITETAAVSVTVKDKLTGISVVEKTTKEYDLYDSINKDDLTVTAHYAAGGDVTLDSSNFTVSPEKFTGEPGTQTVTVTYQGQTATFTVEVNDPGYRITGDGDTYEVHTTEGLLAWNKAVQKNAVLNCTLTADIDLTGKAWTPAGSYLYKYTGTFDGQGHSITGLETFTLFDYMYGEVKNLQLKKVFMEGTDGGTGGLVWNNFGTIAACSVEGTISAKGNPGGIAQANFGTITGCWFSGTLDASDGTGGGIAGYNSGAITACYWSGNAEKGVNVGTGEATKVKGTTTWADAVDGMNAKLGKNDYEWKLTGSTPTLAPKTSETILGTLEQLASHLR